jgi:hypothetical protein
MKSSAPREYGGPRRRGSEYRHYSRRLRAKRRGKSGELRRQGGKRRKGCRHRLYGCSRRRRRAPR